MRHTLLVAPLAAFLGVAFIYGASRMPTTNRPLQSQRKPKLALSIQPRHMTDALRAVIMADRAVYMRISEDWAASDGRSARSGAQTVTLPAPCEMLRLGSQAAASRGVEYSYVLRATQPINSRNRPETEAERKGLQFVRTRPDLSYTTEELLGGRWYFTAVYPDVATAQRCADCHNRAQASRSKTNDVIGALVIRIALEL